MSIYALLVGINTYEDQIISPLSYAEADVTDFGKKLQTLLGVPEDHIHVYTSQQGSHYGRADSILKRLTHLKQIMEPEDTFIFYFAGHGIEKYKDIYFFTTNTNPETHTTLKKTTIQISDIQEELSESRVINRIFITDACRSNPIKGRGANEYRMTESMGRTIEMAARACRHSDREPVVGTLLSCKEKQIAYERRELGHGVFSYFMLQGMDALIDQYGFIQLGQLKTYIDREMRSWCRSHFPAGLEQRPWLSTSGSVPELVPVKQKGPATHQPPAASGPAPAPTRLTVEDLKETGVLEEYIEEGGKLKGMAFLEFFEKIKQKFQIDSAAELKALLQEILERERKKQISTLLARAKAQFKKKAYADSLEALNDLLKLSPDHPEALELKAEAARRKSERFLSDLGIKMISIPGGSFKMGDIFGDGRSNEKPVHRVTLSPYFIGETPVTFAQYDAYCEETGAKKPDDEGWGRGDRPVINVSWFNAVKFCEWLGEKTGMKFRLPTEAQWEYAARSGGREEKYAGTSNEGQLGQYAWYDANSGDKTHPVGKKQPNGLGLYDMSGNVWEWCQDWYDEDYYKNSPEQHPQGPSSGKSRVLRGGSWYFYDRNCRSSFRGRSNPDSRGISRGFRLARD